MRTALENQSDKRAATTSAYPLTSHEMVTDDLLRFISSGQGRDKDPELFDMYQSQLEMVLPDLCGQLLCHRKLAVLHTAPHTPGTHGDQIAALLNDDPNQCERAESVAQSAADEIAEVCARVSELEMDVAKLQGLIQGHAA